MRASRKSSSWHAMQLNVIHNFHQTQLQKIKLTHLKNRSDCNDTHEQIVFIDPTENVHLIWLSSIKLVKDLSKW